jgi:heme oxygenase
VDRLIARLDLACREGYGRLLFIHLAVLQDLESEWRLEDRDDFPAMSRRLKIDLSALGFHIPKSQLMSRKPLAEGNQLGIACVIRGSRLGASVLRPRIPSKFSASYFDFVPTLSWFQFLTQLQVVSTQAGTDPTDAAVRGAKMTFAMFSRLLAEAPA